MNIKPVCILCLISRAYREIQYSTQDTDVQLHAMREVLRTVNSIVNEQSHPMHLVPAYIGTRRDRVIRKITGCSDPYHDQKIKSNKIALELRPDLEKIIGREHDSYRRLRAACMAAIVGNIIEFDVLGHRFKLEEVSKILSRAEEELAIDDIPVLYDKIKQGTRVLYLTDNAGEVALDVLLVRELRRLGAEVTVAVKEKPVLNDATEEDAQAVGMVEAADRVITTGADTVGLILPECSETLKKHYTGSDLIIAKGMGHLETMTGAHVEHPADVFFLLRTKCDPVAACLGVERNRNVAKYLPAGQRLEC
ncbi:MAG: damage-control phosphatase ARMT1 family protein [Candidatus Freyarchaeota archaeon]